MRLVVSIGLKLVLNIGGKLVLGFGEDGSKYWYILVLNIGGD